jgi:hypothetical protein
MREVHQQQEKDFFAILAGDYFIPLDHLAINWQMLFLDE